jgi:hypothetical protein
MESSIKARDISNRLAALSDRQREIVTRHRKRCKRGLFWRPILVTKDQLDQLEVRGYLDPDRRGDRADECDAIQMFLTDSLLKR